MLISITLAPKGIWVLQSPETVITLVLTLLVENLTPRKRLLRTGLLQPTFFQQAAWRPDP